MINQVYAGVVRTGKAFMLVAVDLPIDYTRAACIKDDIYSLEQTCSFALMDTNAYACVCANTQKDTQKGC